MVCHYVVPLVYLKLLDCLVRPDELRQKIVSAFPSLRTLYALRLYFV